MSVSSWRDIAAVQVLPEGMHLYLHLTLHVGTNVMCQGNCKFGLKCANDHITQDGRRVNKAGGYVQMAPGPAPLNLGGRVMPLPAGPPSANSLLTMQAQDQFAQPQPIPGATSDYLNRGDVYGGAGLQAGIDPSYNSLPKSNYGSPPAGDSHLLMSPSLRGIGTTAANAQLPASFDSQGISKYARDGPFAASVPSRFGYDSSPPLPASVSRPIESSALRNLHSSAFGDDAHTNGRLPSSPPTEELLGRRILHSERYSRNSSRMLSASVGARPPMPIQSHPRVTAPEEDWDDNFALEEEMVPNSLHDLLTPAEKARRFSRSAEDELRPSLSGLGTPAEATSKVGSPSHASPSRFGAFFAGQQRARDGSDSSPFGPVGSPLKGMGLHPSASPSLRATANVRPLSGELGPSISSPPRQASMSMISQQLQRTRLSERVSESQAAGSPIQHPGISRVASGGSSTSAGAGNHSPSGRLDRAVSSGSVNVGRDKIDEEPEELFSMDEIRVEDVSAAGGIGGAKENQGWKRSSGGLGAWGQGNPFALGKASPRLGPIGRPKVNGGGAGQG